MSVLLSMDTPPHRGTLAYAGQLLALAVVYVALGILGLRMNPVAGFASLIWPPAGISIAALRIRGYRLWPGVAVGALSTNLWAGAPPLVACSIAMGNTLEAVAGTFVLLRVAGANRSLACLPEVI